MTPEHKALLERLERWSEDGWYLVDHADLKTVLTLGRRGLAADKLAEALRRIDIDNYTTSGSIGPLYDAGFALGWNMARKIGGEGLGGYQSDTGVHET